jgi:hypothetical protein
LPPSPWPSLLLVACHSRRTCHRPRRRCDRGRSPCTVMPPPAKRRVIMKDRRRLGGWLSPCRRASPPALSTLGNAINTRRCDRCACLHTDPFLMFEKISGQLYSTTTLAAGYNFTFMVVLVPHQSWTGRQCRNIGVS